MRNTNTCPKCKTEHHCEMVTCPNCGTFLNPFCEEHQCEFDLYEDEDPPGYPFYDCPVCMAERADALGLI